MPSNSIDTAPRRHSLAANLLLAAVSTVVLFLLIEGLASVLLSGRAAKRTLYMREESHSRYDADLGWSHRPDLRIDGMYGDGTPFTTNARGFRAREKLDAAVPPGKYRVVALGDSFTMGYGVGDESTYAAQMQALCAPLQTVNMGQGGYGIDQDYLWYKRDGAKLDANVLVFAVIAEDFFRMASDSFIGYPKPILRVKNHALVVENVPVPPSWNTRTMIRRARTFVESLAVVRTGYWITQKTAAPQAEQFYGAVGDEVFAAAGLAFDDLAALSKARGQRFVLAYLPISDLLPKEPTREAAWLAEYSRKSGVPFMNLVGDFEKLTPAANARMFLPNTHYSREGNRFVAEAMLRQLAEKVPGFPSCGPAANAAPAAR